MKDFDHLQKARMAWGKDLPDWISGLAHQCNATSQTRVASMLGVSATQISQVIGRTYQGRFDNLRDRYLGVFEAEVVACPALGLLPLNTCRDWRQKSARLHSANAQNVMMYRACKKCPRNKEANDERAN